MPRSRVLSFMSQWGSPSRSPPQESQPFVKPPLAQGDASSTSHRNPNDPDAINTLSSTQKYDGQAASSTDFPQQTTTTSKARGDSRAHRPMSMMQTYTPANVDVAQDTPPELQPIFTYLNSHGNKLYQEGYFLKLHDLDSRGRPSQDRTWVECFAQLIGTVLSLWDAAALDAAGEDGEVVPTFINLSDASIKMIESLPMNGAHGGNLQNVLSVSTAANNRYLLHFNSLNSLTQWTAGIRLAMFEHSTLQEAYTGSLIAGKGRFLNNIKQIMDRSKFAHEDWARVRFGAGTPWRRCWCVVSPPDEKEFSKAQKSLKKSSAYERVKLPKGDIKFYDTRKVTKKTHPIATITDAYAAYAIYPQSKPLIDQSTLVKVEGLLTIHSSMEETSEGFVFVMPEVHPAVTGFEMMLRWLFPVYDTFGLYGRPARLIADSLDQRGLMFAMPRERRYGYLDILDVSALIHTKGSQAWSERHWKLEMKKLTAQRMMHQMEASPRASNQFGHQRRNTANVRFGENDPVHSTPGSRSASPGKYPEVEVQPVGPMRVDSAPPGQMFTSPHKRAASDAIGFRKYQTETPSRLSHEAARPANYDMEPDMPPAPPRHGPAPTSSVSRRPLPPGLQRIQSEPEVPKVPSPGFAPPDPVGTPPVMMHQPNSRPATAPFAPPELRRAHSNVDAATLFQMQEAMRPSYDGEGTDGGAWTAEVQQRQQNTVPSTLASRELGIPTDPPQVMGNRILKQPLQRLSTIPGSPFIGGDAVESPRSFEQAPAPQMDGDGDTTQRSLEDSVSSSHVGSVPTQRPAAEPTPLARVESIPPPSATSLRSAASIARKPVPKPLPLEPPTSTVTAQDPTSPTSPRSPISMEGWVGGMIDEDALDRVLADDHLSTMRTNTTQSSEPDYASTKSASTKPEKPSMEKPRAGKLKTVGDPDVPNAGPRAGRASKFDTWDADKAAEASEIPAVDFGPTYAYKPTSRPGTSGTLTAGDVLGEKRRSKSADNRSRSHSRERLSQFLGGSSHSTPHETNRQSYFGGRNTPSPSRGLTPTGIDEPGNRQSIAWSPSGAPDGSPSNRQALTPEQWVQQRAQLTQQTPQYALPKAVPAYAHERKPSGAARAPRKLTKTPPPGRALSGDWTQQTGRSTPTPPSRPHSRGASVTLDNAAQNLSAKEQMHVSRATGTPLINLPPKGTHQDEDHAGLVGYVSTRERDKANDRSSAAVQQAILQERQQQQMRMEAEAQAQYHLQQQQQQQYAMQQQQFQQQQYQEQQYQHQQQLYQLALAQQHQQQQQQRPAFQSRNSWALSNTSSQQPQPQVPRMYHAMAHSPSSSYGGSYNAPPPPGGYYAQQQSQQQQQAPSQAGTIPRQAYGASFYNQGAPRR